MFEAPLDAWYVWIGLAVVSSAALGVASSLPPAVPPDAEGSARTVDGVAASDHAAVDTHPLSNAEAVRIGSNSISLRGPGGTAHAAFGYGPVTPVPGGSKLERVLRGEPPEAVFRAPSAFERAVGQARESEPRWKETDRLVVRRVTWGETDAVLAG
jgi:hypothetical protein